MLGKVRLNQGADVSVKKSSVSKNQGVKTKRLELERQKGIKTMCLNSERLEKTSDENFSFLAKF